MKKLLLLTFSFCFAGSAFADTCSKGLTGPFPAGQATAICSKVTAPTISGKISGLSGLNVSTTAGFETVAGAGTNQGTGAAISMTKQVHRITGANGTVAWTFGTGVAGDVHFFLNTTAGVANIFPATGGTINGAAANAVFAALTGIKPIICVATTTIDWICS